MTFRPSPEQAAIIDAPLATTRIAAGAGTGKTTTLARRVVHLVTDMGIAPEAILGITFTNKAAQELSDRIRSALTGTLEPGREVSVHTYHGFASVVLQEFGAIVDIERDTDLVTPAFSRQMLAEITSRSAYRWFDPTIRGAVERLRRLGSQLSDNLLLPSEVEAPGPTDHHDPDVWSERLEMLATLELYEREKRRLGVADFGDLILRAHRLVSTHPDIAASIADRYEAVLLDEYQDTDPGQRELLRELFAGNTPVMAVGDADQTIYEWRGASKSNFERFSRHFGGTDGAPVAEFPLSLNRRSGPEILDVANAIRSRIDDGPRAHLTPAPGAPESSVVTALLPTAVAEADWIAQQLIALHESGDAWSDAAILFRKNKDMLLVHDALARHGVPFEVANLGGLLSVPEVADLHAWLEVIAAPEDSVAAARLLLGARFRLGLADLARLNGFIRDLHPASRAGEHEQILDYTLLEAVDALDEVRGLDDRARRALERFRSEYRHLVQVAQGSALVELCREILDHTGAWADIEAMPSARRLSARLNLHRFLDLTEEWSPLEGRPSLTAFIRHLADLELEGSEELDTARLSQSDAVTLITVHRAKGLEWPIVFLPGVYERNFPSGSSGYDDPFRFAYSLPVDRRLDRDFAAHTDPDEYAEFIRARHLEQEWRIAYVAATRAQRMLAVSAAWWNGVITVKKRPSEPSELFHLVDRLGERVVDAQRPDRPEQMFYRSSTVPAPDPDFADGAMAVLRDAIDDPSLPERMAPDRQAYDRAVAAYQQMLFELPQPLEDPQPEPISTSATGLVTYARCPKQYYWTTVDPLPRRFSKAARRGTEVHRRIELHNLGAVPMTDPAFEQPHGEAPPSEAPAGADPFDVFLESRFSAEIPRLTEAPFELGLDAGIRVRGRIDAVYHDEGGWEIVDFKSGRPGSSDVHSVQLETYAVALDRIHDIGDDQLKVTFAYLGGGRLEEVSEVADREWRSEALERLESLGSGIVSEAFEPTPGEQCGGCDFLRFCPAGLEHIRTSP